MTGYDSEVWLLGIVLFDLSNNDAELVLVFTGFSWSMILDFSFDINIFWFITCSASFEKANLYYLAIHMFRFDEWIDMCVIWFLQDTNLKKYLQGPISSTSQATFPVVSDVFTNV